MVKATAKTETVSIFKGVNLELSDYEAQALRELLANVAGGTKPFYQMYQALNEIVKGADVEVLNIRATEEGTIFCDVVGCPVDLTC
jgi:hypothetical protein